MLLCESSIRLLLKQNVVFEVIEQLGGEDGLVDILVYGGSVHLDVSLQVAAATAQHAVDVALVALYFLPEVPQHLADVSNFHLQLHAELHLQHLVLGARRLLLSQVLEDVDQLALYGLADDEAQHNTLSHVLSHHVYRQLGHVC